MALVDYSSSSSASDTESAQDASIASKSDPRPPASKKRKLSRATNTSKPVPSPSADLPPLPSAFHDLYASTVRLSNTDDPSLHQGRKRQIPHIVGNWPSHLYIEWRPQGSEHALLSSLLSTLSSRLSAGEGSEEINVQNFLTSDLGAPLPLHISLSRPLSLTTAQKDEFLDQLRGVLSRSSVGEFELTPTALEWHRTHESSRSFLVLRVASSTSLPDPDTNSSLPKDLAVAEGRKNHELSKLLRHCNALCKKFGQPELYGAQGDDEKRIGNVGDAFHVSVAWSFSEPTGDIKRTTEEVYEIDKHRDGLKAMRIKVDGVKAKIGNVVTHLPLSVIGSGKSDDARERKGLYES